MAQIRLERALCQGHGRCFASLPELFEPDEEGYALLNGDEVPDHLWAKALSAARGCPERAIALED